MNKETFIGGYGEAAYERWLQQGRDWWREHPEEAKTYNQERNRKGGKYYERTAKYRLTGIPHERGLVRKKHANRYRPYKNIIAPDSQIHHEWIPETANFRGVALVEKEQHMHGFIDVIQILEGEITLLTEEEIKIGVL